MIKFANQEFDEKLLGKDDIFVFALGYESRSIALFNKMKLILSAENMLAFVFDDYKKYDYIAPQIDSIINENDICVENVNYDSYSIVNKKIEEMVKNKVQDKSVINIHIDYSSMPRRWYYQLPLLLKNNLRETDKAYFWYVAGKYPMDYEVYPSAGIDSFSVFGKSSLRVGKKRTHIVGLSYDAIRTSALISILDPDSYITCNAYNKSSSEIHNNVKSVNSRVIAMASMEISLQIDDFSFMISKLSELVNEFLPLGDVILVPDGPKPLIFAMSLIPLLVNKVGVTCLHISRNKDFYNAINVEPTDNIYGFSI